MEIKFEIADDKLRNFTDPAKEKLIEQTRKYTLEIISEAEKTEDILRENGASSEITNNTVIQAVRRNKTIKKKNIKIIIIRVIAEVLLFFSGIMFLPEYFITPENTFNVIYFAIFAILTLVAIITTIITYFIGED